MKKRRKHIRLRGYDYSSDGAYFITICTNNREHFFGEIKYIVGPCHGMALPVPTSHEMIQSEIGKIAEQFWYEIPDHNKNIQLDAFVVMPNHIHGILIIRTPVGSCHGMTLHRHSLFAKPIPGSISVIINQFKSAVKRWCNNNDQYHFMWQNRFHDHIIRNEKSYEIIRNYILSNPENWHKDMFH